MYYFSIQLFLLDIENESHLDISMLSEYEEEKLHEIRELIGEHFDNWGICVLTEGDELYYDSNSAHIGEMLFQKAVEAMQYTNIEFTEVVRDETDGYHGEDYDGFTD